MSELDLITILIFGAAALVAWWAMNLSHGEGEQRVRHRLNTTSSDQWLMDNIDHRSFFTRLREGLKEKIAKPFLPKDRETQSRLRQQFGEAGIYAGGAIATFTAAKIVLLVLGMLLGWMIGQLGSMPIVAVVVGALVGYRMPAMWLSSRIRNNKKAMSTGLPDALDLMVVCVEAGLTIDAAIQRVAQELSIAHPVVSRELGIAHMETRVGLSRNEALRNLGRRSGVPVVQSLASMLIQADRFGTSIGQALRIQADALRAERQSAAEEIAAKASVKLSFPLVLFIFPATFIVLAGPTVLKLMDSPIFE